jgi:hypothetical protein
MFRRKRMQTGPAGESAHGARTGPSRPTLPVNPLQEVYARVLKSFLVDGSPSPSARGATTPAGSSSVAPVSPSADGPMAPPPVNAPRATFVGPQTSIGPASIGAPSSSVDIPGLGAVSPQQMETAEAKAQAAIQEALSGADLSHLTPAEVQAVHARLDAMRAGGRLTDEQSIALSQGLDVLSRSPLR